MAKITQKGMWIKISSLKGADKENYIISNVCLLLELLHGVSFSIVGALGGEYAEDATTATEFNIARICVVIFWGIGIYFYSKFLATQDELLKKYHSYLAVGGFLGFVLIGMILSLLSPYFGFKPTFYEYILASLFGIFLAAFKFHRKYLVNEKLY